MIKKYSYGTPFETFAVIKEIEEGEILPYFQKTEYDGGQRFTFLLNKEDIVYGLGETVRGINKRGGRYVSFNTDETNHTPKTPSLYSSHNFIVVDGGKKFGAFFDTPSKVIFEIDYKKSGEIKIDCETKNLRIYIVEGESAYGIVKDFLGIIGQSFLPPLWAFGYGQSRWGYRCEKDFEEVAEGYKKSEIPLDYICMDIDYMDGYADFTVDKERFPDLKAFTSKMREQGIKLVPIIDAGVKIKDGYSVYEEGVKNGYFCTNKEGKNFNVAVWPGMTHFPDFFQPKAREWFGQQYKALTDCGIEGFWNDMNEPAIFYSEYTPQVGFWKSVLYRMFPAKQEGQSNAYKDYKNFYHLIDGKRVLHYDVHNLYGYFMTMSAGEQLRKLADKRYLMFSRSSYIGAHRYGGIWTGDNKSCWEHLKMNVCQMPSLNMCGFLYSGADIGGFGGHTNRELLLRWLAFAVFTPLMRNHSAINTKYQECYRFKNSQDFKSIISLRYRLLPYIYSEYMKAAIRQDMYIKPLAFVYPNDKRAKTVEDQLFVGDSLMIAPVIERKAKGRKVYLPEDMTEVRYDGNNFKCTEVTKGLRKIDVPLNEVVFYIPKEKTVPIGKAVSNTDEVNLDEVTLIGSGKTYEQYIDDGKTYSADKGNIKVLTK